MNCYSASINLITFEDIKKTQDIITNAIYLANNGGKLTEVLNLLEQTTSILAKQERKAISLLGILMLSGIIATKFRSMTPILKGTSITIQRLSKSGLKGITQCRQALKWLSSVTEKDLMCAEHIMYMFYDEVEDSHNYIFLSQVIYYFEGQTICALTQDGRKIYNICHKWARYI